MAILLLVLGVICLGVAQAKNLESCGGKPADVFFLLDSSGSLNPSDFDKELRFTEDVVSMFDMAENNMRVGVATFSKKLTPQIGLGDYSNRSDLLSKISDIKHEAGGTNTGDALRYLHVEGLPRSNTREGLPHIAIILTDGMSQNPRATINEAHAVHDAGIIVFVIGVGLQVDEEELVKIASDPPEKYVYRINNFDTLTLIKEGLAIRACEAEPITPTANKHDIEAAVEEELVQSGSCTPRHALDMVFAVDTASIGASNAQFVIYFIGNVSDHINMETGGVSMATITNGCSGGMFEENEAYDAKSVKSGLSTFEPPKFPRMLRGMRLKASDGWRDSKHVGVVFMMDTLSPVDFRFAQLEQRRAMFRKTEIVVIGVGSRVDGLQAAKLATENGGYIHVYGFESLEEARMRLLYKMCVMGIVTD